jgi:phage replication O-like protein O
VCWNWSFRQTTRLFYLKGVMMKIQKANYTQIPNSIIDEMNELTDIELRLLLAICRKTIGYHKDTDRISLSQIKEITGMTDKSIIKARTLLQAKNIIAWETTGIKGQQKTVYDLNCSVPDTDGVLYPIKEIESFPTVPDTDTKESIYNINKNINKIHEHFDQFWIEYPKKVEKQNAIKAFTALIRNKENLENIIKATKNYKIFCQDKKTEKQFIKHPATFLRNEQWKDWVEVNENKSQSSTIEEMKKYAEAKI